MRTRNRLRSAVLEVPQGFRLYRLPTPILINPAPTPDFCDPRHVSALGTKYRDQALKQQATPL